MTLTGTTHLHTPSFQFTPPAAYIHVLLACMCSTRLNNWVDLVPRGQPSLTTSPQPSTRSCSSPPRQRYAPNRLHTQHAIRCSVAWHVIYSLLLHSLLCSSTITTVSNVSRSLPSRCGRLILPRRQRPSSTPSKSIAKRGIEHSCHFHRGRVLSACRIATQFVLMRTAGTYYSYLL